MTITRKLAAATSVALLAATGVAAAADAPVVSAQRTSTATKAPLTIPGTGIQKGERLPGGARLIYRDVTLEGKQTVTFTLKAPAGKRLRGLVPKTSDVGFAVSDKGSDACRAYQRDLRRLSRELQALNPALALPLLGALAKLVGGGGSKAVAAGAAALVIAATGGVLVLGTDTFEAGDPAPFQLKGVKGLVGKAVTTSDPVPSGTALVTARVRVPAGAPPDGDRRSVTLACPAGMKVAGLQDPEQRFPLSYGLSKGTIIGFSTRARIDLGRAILPRSYDATVGVPCRRPDANGSIADNPRLPRRGEQPGRVCAATEYLYRSPGRVFAGTVFRGQPLAIQRRSVSGRWVRVVTDTRNEGWLRADALCR